MKKWFEKALTNPWLRRYILIGYAAKGTVYLLIGLYAVQAAIYPEQEALGTYLTLSFVRYKPLGSLLVFLLGITLIGYVLRRLFQTILLPGHSNPWSLKSIVQRLGYIASGLSYAGVAYSAFNIVFELGEYDDSIQDFVRGLFERPTGKWLVLLGGILVIAVGISYVYGAYSGSYISDFRSFDLDRKINKWATRIGQVGVASRGVAFILMGTFLIQAAIYTDSKLAGGLQNALRELATKPLGELWLGLIGIGLTCYGIYMFAATMYRRYVIR